MKKLIFILLVSLFVFTYLSAQESDRTYRRAAVMDGNNIKTVYGNWGVIGQPESEGPRGAWLYPTNGYIGDESILLGVEFPIKDYNLDGILDTVHSVITNPVSRPTKKRDEDPLTNQPWTFEPLVSSINPTGTSVAISNDSTSWPASWGNKWNGIDGIWEIVGDLETYFQINDDNDHRFDNAVNNIYGANFTGRNGQGIQVDVRYIQFKDPLYSDVLFKIYDVKNNSKLNYNKVVFGSLMGTYIGVTGTENYQEYDDDYTIYLKNENLIVSGDFKSLNNGISKNPFWQGDMGKFASAFIDAPDNDSITSYNYFSPANAVTLGDDESLWKVLKPGFYHQPSTIVNDTGVISGEDGDYTYGTSYFTLDSGQTKRIASVLVYGNTNTEIIQKVEKARLLYDNDFDLTVGVESVNNIIPLSFNLSQNYPNPFNPNTTIRYSIPHNSFVSLTVYDLLGREVQKLVNEVKTDGNYVVSFNASSLSSGMYIYKLAAGNYSQVKKMMLLK